MEKKKQKDIMKLALRAGDIMMKSGAEIYRVEDTIERICKSCGIENVDVFATPTGIFMSTDNEDASNTVSYIKRIRSSETDLTRISRVNQFSRSFTTTDMTVEEGNKILDDIEKKQTISVLDSGAGSGDGRILLQRHIRRRSLGFLRGGNRRTHVLSDFPFSREI